MINEEFPCFLYLLELGFTFMLPLFLILHPELYPYFFIPPFQDA